MILSGEDYAPLYAWLHRTGSAPWSATLVCSVLASGRKPLAHKPLGKEQRAWWSEDGHTTSTRPPGVSPRPSQSPTELSTGRQPSPRSVRDASPRGSPNSWLPTSGSKPRADALLPNAYPSRPTNNKRPGKLWRGSLSKPTWSSWTPPSPGTGPAPRGPRRTYKREQ